MKIANSNIVVLVWAKILICAIFHASSISGNDQSGQDHLYLIAASKNIFPPRNLVHLFSTNCAVTSLLKEKWSGRVQVVLSSDEKGEREDASDSQQCFISSEWLDQWKRALGGGGEVEPPQHNQRDNIIKVWPIYRALTLLVTVNDSFLSTNFKLSSMPICVFLRSLRLCILDQYNFS